MAVVFAPEYRDPNEELKFYMLQMAEMMGKKRQEKSEQRKMTKFAESLMPTQTPSAGGQGVFTPGGFGALKEGWLGGQPTETGMIQGAQLTPMQIFQKALQSGIPMQQALGVSKLGAQGKPSKIQQSVQEYMELGYDKKKAAEFARMEKLISAGMEPRKSSRRTYEGMTDVEKLDFLSNLKQRGEGPYFGVAGGNKEPRQPKLVNWANNEITKLSMFQKREGKSTPSVTPATEPQSREEFLKTVQSIEDETEAEAYYNKWVSRWQ